MTRDKLNVRTYKTTCRACDRDIEMWMPIEKFESVNAIRIRCAKCGTTNYARAKA